MFVMNKDIEFQQVDGGVRRKVLAHDGSLMAVEVYFDKMSDGLSLHQHKHEQVTYVVKGKVKFTIGGEKPEERIVTPGDTIYFASNVPHGCVVLEEGSLVLDVFTPQREDFLK